MKAKSDEITAFLWKCPLSRLEAWTFYYACYLPSVGYPLPCSFMTKSQLETIQSKAMSIIVPRCGYNRNTKKDILYGPMELGGASFRHLYVEQGIGQIKLFLRSWRSGSVAGRLLRIAVGWFQAQAGTSVCFLENVATELPHPESKWIASLRSFLASIEASLQLDVTGVSAIQRQHDFHIMDGILESKLSTDVEIKRLNYCRLFLQANTISDITKPDGCTLDHSMLRGAPSLQSGKTRGVTIHQARPSEKDWSLWRKANQLWSNDSGNLHQALGPWIVPIHNQRQTHHSYSTRREVWVRIDSMLYVRCTPTGQS